MDLYDVFKWVLLPIILAYIGYNERDKVHMRSRVDTMMTTEEVEKMIDLKTATQQVQIQDIKDDLIRIESKLDKVLDKLMD